MAFFRPASRLLPTLARRRSRRVTGGCRMRNRTKHAIHCLLFISWVAVFVAVTRPEFPKNITIDEQERSWYNAFLIPIDIIRMTSHLLLLPQLIFGCIGLLAYSAFQRSETLSKNVRTCQQTGIENYWFEVVTDNQLNLKPQSRLVREIVVPGSYQTLKGSLYKARALQYCLEDGVSPVTKGQWIVHLDEESLLTPDAVRGILNFCSAGTSDFGQGMITYASDTIVSWFCTFADSLRVADDLGKLRASFNLLRRPYFSWKGSYVVARYSAEKLVGFDHGFEGSIAEDCFFAMVSMRYGLSYGYIDGVVHEKSPFSVDDLIKQRRRWFQGIWMTIHSNAIPYKHKALLTACVYGWAALPVLIFCFMLPSSGYFGSLTTYDMFLNQIFIAINVYQYAYGAFISFKEKYSSDRRMLLLCVIGAVCVLPFNALVEATAVLYGLISRKIGFHIIQKSISSTMLDQKEPRASIFACYRRFNNIRFL
ncbi:unnamed protein product, partial [Mesorhabditis spiculigera]